MCELQTLPFDDSDIIYTHIALSKNKFLIIINKKSFASTKY